MVLVPQESSPPCLLAWSLDVHAWSWAELANHSKRGCWMARCTCQALPRLLGVVVAVARRSCSCSMGR